MTRECWHVADAFDDLVKEAVRTANAAAQSRADYAAGLVAAEMAEARRDRVASKRGRRRFTSPKTPKRLAWASEEKLVQHRVFSKVSHDFFPTTKVSSTDMAICAACIYIVCNIGHLIA